METELLLLNAAKAMDKEALVKIFELYASPLYNYALRLCRDPLLADHIVGDVFAKLLERFASGRGPISNLRSYLYEMTYHIIVDEARSLRRRAPLDALVSPKSDVYSGILSSEDQIMIEMIFNAIQHELTDDQRHVITLRFLEEFSIRETAAILGKDEGHVKVIQSRALAKLRQVFESKEIRTAVILPKIRELSKTINI